MDSRQAEPEKPVPERAQPGGPRQIPPYRRAVAAAAVHPHQRRHAGRAVGPEKAAADLNKPEPQELGLREYTFRLSSTLLPRSAMVWTVVMVVWHQ